MTSPSPEPATVAAEVVGLPVADAVATVTAAGLDPVVVAVGTTAVTMEFRPERVRLFPDDEGRVARATAG